MKCNIKPKGYNIFQARIYTITDELSVKTTFLSKPKAIQYIMDFFRKENDGQLFSRGVIRTIDPVLRVWIVPWSIDNPNALLLDEKNTVIDAWRTTFYDMGDAVLLSRTYENDISEEQIEKQMMALNAFSAVVACHEAGPSERFVITRTYRNKRFSLHYLNYNPEAGKLKPGETLEQRYQHLFDEDAAETERINATRKTQIHDKHE